MNAVKGVTFEKDAKGNNRYIRIDMVRKFFTFDVWKHIKCGFLVE
jgi:hypothetical protein